MQVRYGPCMCVPRPASAPTYASSMHFDIRVVVCTAASALEYASTWWALSCCQSRHTFHFLTLLLSCSHSISHSLRFTVERLTAGAKTTAMYHLPNALTSAPQVRVILCCASSPSSCRPGVAPVAASPIPARPCPSLPIPALGQGCICCQCVQDASHERGPHSFCRWTFSKIIPLGTSVIKC